MAETKQVTAEHILRVQEISNYHLQKTIEEKGNTAFHSTHESLGVITEEYYELVEAVKKNDGTYIDELLDIITACKFALASVYAHTNI